MKLENEFTVNVGIDRAWEVLTDIPLITPCLPGAKLTESDGDNHSGKVKIKVGPITAEYSGSATFVEKDETNHKVVIDAKGRDSRGSGNASAIITATMTPQGEATVVAIDTDLKIAGKVAQFGKGVIGDVSKKLIDQFVDCIEAKLADDAGNTAADVAGASAEMSATEAASAGTTASSAAAAAKVDEPMEALDIMDVAGGAVGKRVAPLAGAGLLAFIIWLITR